MLNFSMFSGGIGFSILVGDVFVGGGDLAIRVLPHTHTIHLRVKTPDANIQLLQIEFEEGNRAMLYKG
jgi:hypothetical protein